MYQLKPEQKDIIKAMRECFAPFPEVKETEYHQENYYGIRRMFPNGMRCDLFFMWKEGTVLRFSRGAWMVSQEPMLGLLFDEVLRVIAKIRIQSVDTIKEKAIPSLIARVAGYPKKVGALEYLG